MIDLQRVGAFLVLALFLPSILLSQTLQQKAEIAEQYDQAKLESLAKSLKESQEAAKTQAIELANQNGWPVTYTFNGFGQAEIAKIGPNGAPIYYQTDNVDAAISTRVNHVNSGGSLGLSLDGQGMTAHVWDGGATRGTHQEFDGPGGSNRVTQGDGATSLSDHATHVTGTIVASGFTASAKGMASHAQASTFDWNSDLAEMASQASGGMLISNHSYGYGWRNQFGQVQLPAWYGGAYIAESRDLDQILYDAPYYMMFSSGGNDGDDNTANTNPLDGNSNYDKLNAYKCSKNNVVVAAANDANVNPDGTVNSFSIASFSSEGPTDDYRIKPDITGNGVGVYSSLAGSNSSYGSYNGTSMSSPNVAGSALLLQQHYNNVNGSFMRGATLKALILHTADDGGSNGPDAIYGWGLMNTKAAAEAINNAGNTTMIQELTLNQGQTYQITVNAAGGPLFASICWTDPAGTANTGTANDNTPVLVNDLDIRVTQNTSTYFPWALTGVTTNAKQDNVVDPYERVDIDNASGSYTITVTHKGSLASGSQAFSLVVTGLTACTLPAPNNLAASNIGDNSFDLNWDAVSGANGYTVTIGGNSTTVSGTSYSATGLIAGTSYDVSVSANCAGGGSGTPATTNVTTTGTTPLSCNGNVSSFPYAESFEAGAGWTQEGGDDGDWVNYSGSTPSTGTGPGSAADGSFYMYLEASTNGTAGQIGNNATAILGSPCFDLSGATSATFSFQNHMYGANMGSLTLEATSNDQTWTNLWSLSGNQGNQWNAVNVDLSAYAGGQVKLRFVGTTGPGWESDLAIDDLNLTTGGGGGGDTQPPSVPDGLAASNIQQTSFTLSWNASSDNVGVTGYTVYANGSSIGTVTGTSANITGLTASTTYSMTVDAFDAAGNTSAQSSALNVTTDAAPDTDPPSVPTGLASSNVTSSSFDVSWNASSDNVGVTGYNVYLDGVLDGTTAGTSYSFSGLSASTAYDVNISAYDAAGNTSAQSATLTETTSGSGGGGSTVISASFFETGWDDWNDGGSDCARRAEATNSWEGNYSIRIRDNTNSSVMTTDPLNLAGYSSIDIEFYFRPVGMENGEDFWLQYNSGSGWQTVAVWVVGQGGVANNNFYTSTVNIDGGAYNLVNGGQFRFRNDASVNNDRVFIDAVTITGNTTSGNGFVGQNLGGVTTTLVQAGPYPMESNSDIAEEFESDLHIYPSPAESEINIATFDDARSISLYTVDGKLIRTVEANSNNNVMNVSDLAAGMYLIQVITEEETLQAKFSKK
jgi:chitodextrinase